MFSFNFRFFKVFQLSVNKLYAVGKMNLLQSRADGFQLNESKCKEVRISFTKSENTLEPVTINNMNIEVVPSAKLLGVMISNDLKWNVHAEMICKKVAVGLYFLRQLKHAKVTTNDLLSFYTTCIYTPSCRVCMHVQSFKPLYRNISPIS